MSTVRAALFSPCWATAPHRCDAALHCRLFNPLSFVDTIRYRCHSLFWRKRSNVGIVEGRFSRVVKCTALVGCPSPSF